MPDVTAEYRRVNLSSDPIYGYLRITKGGRGGVPGEVSEQELLDHAWLQRLRRIHQLQSAWWVFATAEHSRFQHSLGAMHLAGEWVRHLDPTLREVHSGVPSPALLEETLRLAGLLHDVGHGPFGHFFDENYLDRWRIDHEVIGRVLVEGPLADLIGGLGASPHGDFERGEAVDPRWVAYLISKADLDGFEPPPWLAVLKPLLTGPFSADNMDYVPRDSYICGVASGPVDIQRILHYSFISKEGLTLHDHGAEALFMFLSARLYLYNQVYFHRTVRRIDLQLREIFRPTMDRLLGGNPLDDLDRYRSVTEWYLMDEVDRWARGDAGPELRELGREWSDIVARRLKWRLIYSTYIEIHELDPRLRALTRDEFAARIRAELPRQLRETEFEVDIATQGTQAINPLTETVDVVLYDPLEDAYRRSAVIDLFRRLPARISLCRIFAHDGAHRPELVAAADRALAPS
ncbi:MAG: HD domain-containing protein [Chloroflexi bacterium]|nr:MAG: HD domain-containing protein [Chloroflexota bacterium]TME19563.1 MAG: HD domain-containing protein [Chloroflexota bacterium]